MAATITCRHVAARRARACAALMLAAAVAWTTPGQAQTSLTPSDQITPPADITNAPYSMDSARGRLENARRMIDSGQAAEARELLRALRSEPGIDQNEVRFLLAMAALRSGDPAAAIAGLRDLLGDHPELVRVRLELARALFDTGSDEGARFHFARLRAMADLPAAVRANVERFIDALNSRRGWTAGLVVALLPDSNVNSGTAAQSVTLYGLPGFVPSEDLQQQSGIGLYVRGSLGRVWPASSSFAWVGRVNLVRRDFTNSNFDDMTVRTDFGPRWIADRDEVGVLGVLSGRWMGNESANHGAGVRLEWSRRIENWWHSSLALERLDYRWRLYPELNGAATRLSGLQYWNLDATTAVYAGAEWDREQLRARTASSQRISGLIGASRDFGHGWSLGAQWRLAVTRYDEALAAFDYVDRRDVTNTLSFSVAQRTLQWRGLMPVLYVSFILNDSSLELYSYHRAVAQIGLSRSF